MESILNKKENEQYEIIKLLYSEMRYWTIAEIQEKIFLSKVTISKNLEAIDTMFEKYDGQISLIFSKKGVYLEKAFDFNLSQILLVFLEESLFFKFIHVLFTNRQTTVKKFCGDNYISISYFYKLMKQHSHILENYQVHIDFINMEFVGEEISIRHFLFNFYWNSYKGIEWPFKEISEKELLDSISQEEATLNVSISYIERAKYCYFVAISRNRIGLKHYSRSYRKPYYFFPNEAHEMLRNALKGLFNSEVLPEDIAEREITQLEILLNIYLRTYEDFDAKRNIIMNSMLYNATTYRNAKLVLAEFKKTLLVDFSTSSEFLVTLLKIHAQGLLLRESATVYKKDELLNYYNEKYPTYSRLLKQCIENLEKETDFNNPFQQKDFLFLKYTFLLERYYDLSFFEKEIKIRVLLSEGLSLERILAREIEKKISGNIKILTETYKKDNADIIISDFNLSIDDNATLFVVNYPLVEGDWVHLSALVKRLSSI
ncbi:helix-turn-helix domain-containing protein [Carnobacterium maltaromaticum]|uniref:helix-turn-helix domain-containing protein n=1 Tax=Carnobacterium maltaromaticum TaxID=2751 RepID=UPI00295F464F|nr:helix-turn-helix domain-containing protein [Carnobacterium maltaromaticum]